MSRQREALPLAGRLDMFKQENKIETGFGEGIAITKAFEVKRNLGSLSLAGLPTYRLDHKKDQSPQGSARQHSHTNAAPTRPFTPAQCGRTRRAVIVVKVGVHIGHGSIKSAKPCVLVNNPHLAPAPPTLLWPDKRGRKTQNQPCGEFSHDHPQCRRHSR
jgi:hypothetical protein